MLAQESNCAHVRDHRRCGCIRESGLQRPFVHRAVGRGHFTARLLRLHLEHHHDADRGVPDLYLRWLVHQTEDHRGRDHGFIEVPLACSVAHHDQVHRTYLDRDRVHLVPRPIPRLHDYLVEQKELHGLRSASLVILHETSFTIGLATNALLICANLKPQTATFGSPFYLLHS